MVNDSNILRSQWMVMVEMLVVVIVDVEAVKAKVVIDTNHIQEVWGLAVNEIPHTNDVNSNTMGENNQDEDVNPYSLLPRFNASFINHPPSDLSKHWILLDSCSSSYLIAEKSLLHTMSIETTTH